MSKWFKEQRLKWIAERINPFQVKDLMDYFSVSRPQASRDINDYITTNPSDLSYNKRLKRYEKVIIELGYE
jgi:hypothetical protein